MGDGGAANLVEEDEAVDLSTTRASVTVSTRGGKHSKP